MINPVKMLIRSQLSLANKFIMPNLSIEATRQAQGYLGSLMSTLHLLDVTFEDFKIGSLDACFITPHREYPSGIILYLHGGGYTFGDINYSKGFASMLSHKCGIKVMSVAYRLAPENQFPCALDDCLSAYEYLLSVGYKPEQIVLFGESAGGGLCFSLCHKLKELGKPMPSALVTLSAWTDLTQSQKSYEKNRDNDPSMTKESLDFFAKCYCPSLEDEVVKNPLISPLYGDLSGFPPCLLLVGEDEIMLDDSVAMYNRLLELGVESELITTPEMWHAYLLYGLKENDGDFEKIRRFVIPHFNKDRKPRWLRLDNVGKIYPAVKTRNWVYVFRLSADLNEKIDAGVMQRALDITVKRFPSIAVRLRIGFFWYYLEELKNAPSILSEQAYPFARTLFDDIRKCAFRALVYENRIAIEFFHSITDGNGGLIFLKTLIAEYMFQKHGAHIPNTNGVLDRFEEPSDEELVDSVEKYAGEVGFPRSEKTAFKITGTPSKKGFKTNTTFILDAPTIVNEAKRRGVTVTAFMTSVLMLASWRIQDKKIATQWRKKPIKVLIPVNLRNIFPSKSLRNFVLFITPGIEPKYGEMSFDEICTSVNYQMRLELTPRRMGARMATNLNPEKMPLLRIFPLFMKNIVMRTVFYSVGEKKSCLTLSNLGVVTVPKELEKTIKRFDFLLDVQSHAPYNSGLITYNNTMYLNIIRNIKENHLERELYQVFKDLGIKVRVESNIREEK